MISGFPKIFALGTDYIRDILEDEVEITEKIDGSQFVFGKDLGGDLHIRSKGAIIYPESVQKMFTEGVDYVMSIQHLIPDGLSFYCEYLKKPKHNTLAYERIPKNHLMLFGVMDTTKKFYDYFDIKEWAETFDIECVPLVHQGETTMPEIFEMIKSKSVLGGIEMEGCVVKNYHKPFLLGGQPIPLMAGKYVSENFKERHQKDWAKQTGKGKWDEYKESYRTEARWRKAVEFLRDSGELDLEPKDIGKLMKCINQDIEAECRADIERFLWKEFGKEVLRTATRGMPEWYKKELALGTFRGDDA